MTTGNAGPARRPVAAGARVCAALYWGLAAALGRAESGAAERVGKESGPCPFHLTGLNNLFSDVHYGQTVDPENAETSAEMSEPPKTKEGEQSETQRVIDTPTRLSPRMYSG